MNKTIKKITYKILGFIFNFFLFIISMLIFLEIIYIYQIKIQKNDYGNIFGYTFFEVITGSMSPTINVGDLIIVKVTNDINENDIIVYKEENSYITHRLIKKEENMLQTKGDANNVEDKLINYESVIGKVEKVIPKIGIYKKILMEPEIIGLLLLLIVIVNFLLMHNSKNGGKE